MEGVVIDSYPLRRWLVLGTTELPNYGVLKEYLVEKYKVCYFCEVPVVAYSQVNGQPMPDDTATIEHITPRQHRKRFEYSLKVLCCHKCNQERNTIEQRKN